jgi:hypothetical protein
MRKSVLVLLCALANSPAAAKDTGLIFVSNDKTTTSSRSIRRATRSSRRSKPRAARATCISTRIIQSCTSLAATTT